MNMIRRMSHRGVTLITVTALLGVTLLLLVLIVDVSVTTNAKKQLSYVATLAGEEALRKYREANAGGFTQARVDSAVSSANSILQMNSLMGFGPLRVGTEPGTVVTSYEFGVWHAKANAQCSDPPCFQENVSPAPANAVRVTVKTVSGIGYFARAAGVSNSPVRASAIVTARQRCLDVLLDVTGSAAQQTHISNPNLYQTQLLSLYAFPDIPELQTCPAAPNYVSAVQYIWCNMPATRADFYDVATYPQFIPFQGNDPKTIHARDEYVSMSTPIRDPVTGVRLNYMIDLASRPEPLRSLLLGINSTVREVLASGAPGDKFRIRAFDQSPGGNMGDPADVLVRDTGFYDASNLSYLLQVTNFDNVNHLEGDTITPPAWGETHPNPIDVGFFPRVPAYTNIEAAIREGISDLSDPQFCENDSEKYLVLISDGIMNCARDDDSSENYEQCPFGSIDYCMYELPDVSNTICGDTYAAWDAVRFVLENPYFTAPLLPAMQSSGIKFFYMGIGLSGPNVFNVEHPDYTAWAANPIGPEPPKFYDITQLLEFPSVRHDDITCCAYQGADLPLLGNPGVYFEEPNLLWMKWVLATGGAMLPLRAPPPADECEQDTSENVYNENASPMRHAYTYRNGRTTVITNTRPANTIQYYDPYCRTIPIQVQNNLKQILGGSNYVPVELD